MNFFQFNEKFQKVNPDRVIMDAVLLMGNKAIELNQQQLYQYSEDSEGKPLKEYASGEYAIYKDRLNPYLGLGKSDLRETGEFYNSAYVEVDMKTIKFDSTDIKTDSLERKYGSKIFGLNKMNMAYFANQYVIPKVREEIKLLTGI